MSSSYYLYRIKHELCLVNDVVKLNDQLYSIDMPVVIPVNKLNATDGRSLLQRIIFQHFNSNLSRQIGFMRGMITLSSEPDHFQTHMMMNCAPDQMCEPSETEWVNAIQNGLDTGESYLPLASLSTDVKINAWGIKNFIYDVKIEFWPDNNEQKTFICDCLIKFINPLDQENSNELDFEQGFNFLIFSKKNFGYIPFLIASENKPYFFLNDAEILEHEMITYDDGIGKELFVKCKIQN